jgi:hypothetical protein
MKGRTSIRQSLRCLEPFINISFTAILDQLCRPDTLLAGVCSRATYSGSTKRTLRKYIKSSSEIQKRKGDANDKKPTDRQKQNPATIAEQGRARGHGGYARLIAFLIWLVDGSH